jgi:predicted nucleic acid-binding protein
VEPAVIDASVAIPWFHEEGEQQVAESRAIAAAVNDRVRPVAPDLLRWEVGHVLLRKRGIAADLVNAVLLRLQVLVPGYTVLDEDGVSDAVALAGEHGLSVYDASYWALARATGAVLVTLDSALLAAGAGVTPAALCQALGLEVE